jgi:hypothetical protein
LRNTPTASGRTRAAWPPEQSINPPGFNPPAYQFTTTSKGTISYIAQRNAEAEAARIIGQPIEQVRAVLKKAGIEDIDDVLQAIWESDAEE